VFKSIAEKHLGMSFDKRAEFRRAEKTMREWREKSDWSEDISPESISKTAHNCGEPKEQD
jgi:hypothetical protein